MGLLGAGPYVQGSVYAGAPTGTKSGWSSGWFSSWKWAGFLRVHCVPKRHIGMLGAGLYTPGVVMRLCGAAAASARQSVFAPREMISQPAVKLLFIRDVALIIACVARVL
eukprot:scaffold10565_cov129-Isochrysis_galbana.AAC.1